MRQRAELASLSGSWSLLACTLHVFGCATDRGLPAPGQLRDGSNAMLGAACMGGGEGDGAVDARAEGQAEPPDCKPDGPALVFGPLLSAVSDRSVKVWVKADQPAQLSVTVWPLGKPTELRRVRVETSGEPSATVTLDELTPETDYQYQVSYDGCACSAVRQFRTLREAGAPGRVRFATAGDVNGANIPGFIDIAEIEPAFVLMVGDNVYADGFGESEDVYRRRYDEVWGGSQLHALFSTTPAFRIWDDHELVDNYWEGKNDQVYAFARKLYDEYQGGPNPDPLVPGELYYAFEVGDVGFFVLDTRTHRVPNGATDDDLKSMLGAEQKELLLAWLADDRYRVHVVVSSVLVSDFSTTGRDAWSAFSTEREETLGAIARARTSNVLVISGDQHWSAIVRLDRGDPPYTIYEFQATPLGFDERGAPMTTDPNVIALDNTHRVFGVFDIDTSVEPVTVEYTLCAVGTSCRPHEEPAPVSMGTETTVPYTMRFLGGDSGLVLHNER